MWMFSGDVTVSDAISFIQSYQCYIRRCRTFENRTQFNSVEEHLKHFILQLLFFCLEKLIKYLRMLTVINASAAVTLLEQRPEKSF